MNTIINKIMILTSTDGAKSAISKTGNELATYGSYVAVVAIIMIGLTLIIGPGQMKEMAKQNLLWVIVGLILVATAPAIVGSFSF